MVDLQFVDFALMLGLVRQEKQFGLLGDVCKTDVIIFSRMSHPVLQNTMAMATRPSPNKAFMGKTMPVRLHNNSRYISLPSSAEQRSEMTKFRVNVVWRM